MEKLLTVSVAAYNMERFLEQNLESFVASGVLDRVEVLVVDDGSTDGTGAIASRYEEAYPGSIRWIRQENAGPGSTVNRGMENATGRYFRMVDADDWVEPQGFAALVAALENTDADMVVCPYSEVDNDTGEERPVPLTGAEPGAADLHAFCRTAGPLAMHNVTWRTALLRENGIRLFDCYYTDLQYLYFPLLCAKTVRVLPDSVYRYRVSLSTQSMSVPSMQRHLDMHDRVLFSLCERLESAHVDESVASYVADGVTRMAGAQLGTLLSFAPCREKKQALSDFQARLRAASTPVWARYSRLKTVRLLRLPGGYAVASRLHRRKYGIR
ncbi:MAG: glycosyltransferase [Clostridia bacterium]|nr:glycosyltransferase [Clostridia bacterium]